MTARNFSVDDIPDLLGEAKRRIILHAAIYSPFASSPRHHRSIKAALERDSFNLLDIISIYPGDINFFSDFMQMLRPEQTKTQHLKEITESQSFTSEIAAAYPQKVCLHRLDAVPMLPVVVADNQICFGHYAHSPLRTAEGLWFMLNADVEKLLNKAVPNQDEKGAYRILCECSRFMNRREVAHEQ